MADDGDTKSSFWLGSILDGVDHSIITVAGDVENLVGGFSGDGGPSTQALIGNLGAAVDANHNLFIADGFERVRKVHLAPVTALDQTLFTGAFGNVLAGQASLSQDITISNNGLDDLLISNFTFPASFAVFSTCSGLNVRPQLAAGQREEMSKYRRRASTGQGDGKVGLAGLYFASSRETNRCKQLGCS